jgi:nitrogen regulatory protein PII
LKTNKNKVYKKLAPVMTQRNEKVKRKVKIEIVCNDEVAEIFMDRIVTICQTGQVGDGVVWCTEVPKTFFISKSTP